MERCLICVALCPESYTICGLSYFNQHINLLPGIGSKWALFQDSVRDGSKGICLRYSHCFSINILAPPDTVFLDSQLCNSDTLFFLDTFLIQEGRHLIGLEQSDACDSIFVININRLILNAQILEPDTLSCANDDVLLDGSGSMYPPNTIITWNGEFGGINDTIQPDIVRVDRNGKYEIVLENASCKDSAEVIVHIDSLVPSISILGDTITCSERDITLQAVSNGRMTNFEWFYSNALIQNADAVNVDSAGIYTVIVTDANGCSNTARFEVIADTLAPQFELLADTIDCLNDSATVMIIDSTNFTSITWTGPTGQAYNGGGVKVSPPGNYLVEVISNNGCGSIDSIRVFSDLDTPNVELTLDTIDCRNPSVNIIPSTFEGLRFDWYNSNNLISTDSILNVDSSGDYVLIVTGDNGCTTEIQFIVVQEYEELGIVLTADSLKCENIDAKVWLEPNSKVIDPVWIDPLGTRSNGDTAAVTEAGWYIISFSAPSGCLYNDSLFVKDHRTGFDISLLADTITCNDPTSEITLQSSNTALTYLWLSGSDTLSTNPNLIVSGGGEFVLKATDTLGCTVVDTIEVQVDTVKPIFSVSGIDTLNCRDTVITLRVNGLDMNWSSEWSAVNGAVLGSSDSLNLIQSGDYYLKVTGSNGCRDSLQLRDHSGYL